MERKTLISLFLIVVTICAYILYADYREDKMFVDEKIETTVGFNGQQMK